ncbi:MAG: gas vesicle protein GvpG [Acidobacteria bacterium]|nr:gas vesicle protein GvpG [Acidobacteriota bacterium]MBI3280451.1 gas vesicle protein GvpG [Acidobacteriota bacterium]
MFLIDDILLSPVHGVVWICKEVFRAAQEEQADEGDRIRAQLCNLYMMLETAQISEEEFAAQEKVCLDRLELLESGEMEEIAAPGQTRGSGPDRVP